jgi:hypothetical protein
MPRRGRFIQYGASFPATGHSTPGGRAEITCPPQFRYNEVPEEWRKHAREPWRILFPDLEWAPAKTDDNP